MMIWFMPSSCDIRSLREEIDLEAHFPETGESFGAHYVWEETAP